MNIANFLNTLKRPSRGILGEAGESYWEEVTAGPRFSIQKTRQDVVRSVDVEKFEELSHSIN